MWILYRVHELKKVPVLLKTEIYENVYHSYLHFHATFQTTFYGTIKL